MRRSVAAALTLFILTGCGADAPLLGPGRPWHLAYNGYGHVSASAGGGARLTLEPARAMSPASTHAALVLSRRSWGDLTADVQIRTNRQLRQPHPNAWEVGWLLWHYADDEHFYYIALKPNGWELGKADPAYPGGQRFLATGTRPTFPTAHWYAVRVQQRGNEIQVSVGGQRLVRLADTQDPYLSGRVGLYVEDASATFRPIAFSSAS